MKFIIYQDQVRQYRWRLKANNEKIIADSAEGYHNKNDILNTIKLIKNYVHLAETEDETLVSILEKLLKK